MESRCTKGRIITMVAVVILIAIGISVLRTRRSGDARVLATSDDTSVEEILT
ncbi:hypothetical protein ACFLQ7_01390 [Actinomycetota bacterium]|jgi:hypothetical protein